MIKNRNSFKNSNNTFENLINIYSKNINNQNIEPLEPKYNINQLNSNPVNQEQSNQINNTLTKIVLIINGNAIFVANFSPTNTT